MNTQTAQITAMHKLETRFRMAQLIEKINDHYLLQDEGFQLPAVAAFSCLVKPQPGDQVMYASTEDGQNIILSIVSRQGSQDMAIEFPENARLNSGAGSIQLNANESITLASSGLNMLSKTQRQKTDEAYFNVRDMHANGEKLTVNFGSMMVLSKFISTIARQSVQKFFTYMRQSESFDQVKAANMTRSSKGLFSVSSDQTVLNSKSDTKIDGQRIHIG